MFFKKYPWKKSALRRLIFSFICILLPLYLLSMIIYNWGVRTLHDEISASMASQVSQYFAGMEDDFKRIQILQYDALSDDNLNRLGAIPDSLTDIEKMQSILRLQQRLNAIRNSSNYIKDVYAYIPAVQKVISALTISAFDQKQYEVLSKFPFNEDSPLMNVDGSMYLSAVYPFTTPNSHRVPIFIIAIEIAEDKLSDKLRTMVNTTDEGIIYKSPQFVVATSGDKALNNKMTARMNGITGKNNVQSVSIGGKRYLAVYTSSPYFGAVLCKYVPESAVFEPLHKYRNWFIMLAAVSFIIIVVYSLYVYKYIHKPLDKLVKAFRKVEFGDFNVRIGHRHNDEFQYMYTRFNAMAENLKSLIDQVYKQQILAQKAELKQLQSQINPHFLYNSFFILNTMSRLGDYDNLELFSSQLGEYFQFVTRNSADEVPLEREAHHAKVYADIQAMRFSNRVRIDFGELPAQMGHVMVPRLILQPVIENAFEHGLEHKASNGLLQIRFHKEDNLIRITMEDNGERLDAGSMDMLRRSLRNPEGAEMTGLLNIHQRIRLKYGRTSGLDVEQNEWGGLRATITIDIGEGGE
ncbi:sensor histidine kinase [Paenibacillus protaetiae]|uniref:HAMP domain-containing protein n=1 Tax=Paenibacillus protaetiae TaxID=2509456 RepID=A0A4V0YES8_9BACL|nr:histidine kinase [Paenibacillus protaetiae]QAY65261.1 HAMP domain-containing protein [Paenibacillus protaetiae]